MEGLGRVGQGRKGKGRRGCSGSGGGEVKGRTVGGGKGRTSKALFLDL